MDKRNLFERTKKGGANVQGFYESNLRAWTYDRQQNQSPPVQLAGRDDGMAHPIVAADDGAGRDWTTASRVFAVGMIGKHICCAAICKPNWAVLCAANVRAATERWSKAYLLQISNVEGAKAHDDFTSSILGHDVILDAKRGLAGVFDLARWNCSRGELRLIAA
jgi:hypothetical protein